MRYQYGTCELATWCHWGTAQYQSTQYQCKASGIPVRFQWSTNRVALQCHRGPNAVLTQDQRNDGSIPVRDPSNVDVSVQDWSSTNAVYAQCQYYRCSTSTTTMSSLVPMSQQRSTNSPTVVPRSTDTLPAQCQDPAGHLPGAYRGRKFRTTHAPNLALNPGAPQSTPLICPIKLTPSKSFPTSRRRSQCSRPSSSTPKRCNIGLSHGGWNSPCRALSGTPA